jgi:hypothetical protein
MCLTSHAWTCPTQRGAHAKLSALPAMVKHSAINVVEGQAELHKNVQDCDASWRESLGIQTADEVGRREYRQARGER